MPNFEPTGDLLTDIQQAIDNATVIYIEYVDRKGSASVRTVAPLEVRGDRFYAADLDKMALRLFILDSVTAYDITDETFDKDSLNLSN